MFTVAGCVGVPITLLIVATVVVFGPWAGAAYALVGAELAALGSFGLGHALGRDAVGRLGGAKVNRISRKLADHGLLTTIMLRIVPVAPFAVINVIAGVSGVRFRDFALGNLVGVLPAVLVVAFLTDRVVDSLREPSMAALGVLAATILFVAGGALALRYWLRSRTQDGG